MIYNVATMLWLGFVVHTTSLPMTNAYYYYYYYCIIIIELLLLNYYYHRIIIIIIIIIIISFTQVNYTYIPEKNYIPREYSVTAILLLLFMVLISLVSLLNLLYFTLVLSEVCVQRPIWLFSEVPCLHDFLVCCSRLLLLLLLLSCYK